MSGRDSRRNGPVAALKLKRHWLGGLLRSMSEQRLRGEMRHYLLGGSRCLRRFDRRASMRLLSFTGRTLG
jgi:hypothetical protein